MENIDDEADQLGIGFVKIHDEDLADEYNLGSLPTLVYYRHQIPIIYEGKIEDIFLFVLDELDNSGHDGYAYVACDCCNKISIVKILAS